MQSNTSSYKPAPILTYGAIAFLALWIFSDFFNTVMEGVTVMLGGERLYDEGFNNPTSAIVISLSILAALSLMCSYLGCVVFFLMSIFRARKNVDSFGVTGMKHSAGGTVGWFFVPIACLFKPFQVISEIWKASDPKVDASNPTGWIASAGSMLLNFWWALWIISNLADNGLILLTIATKYTTTPLTFTVTAITFILDTISALLAMAVLFKLYQRQQEKHRQLQLIPPAAI